MLRFLFIFFGFGMLASVTFAAPLDPKEGYIGVSVSSDKDNAYPVVDYVAVDSPAAVAGIRLNDEIEFIEDESFKGISSTETMRWLDGKIGTPVELTLRREGSPDIKVTVTRRSFVETYSSAAMAGDAKAQARLGYFYESSPAPTRDLAKALEWYSKAADQGYAPAQNNLGAMYCYGLGVTKNQETAMSWYLKAAQQGAAPAERNVALGYFYGKGVPQSDRDAFNWFYSSAQQEDPYGQKDLAYMYEHGRGVKQSNEEALKWYLKAQKSLPQGEARPLKKLVALLSLEVFLEDRHSAATFDLSMIAAAFQQELWCFFLGFAGVYLVSSFTLLYFTFRATDISLKLSWGWIVFYIESQGAAFLGLCVLGTKMGAGTLMGAISAFCALPVILSSCGSVRTQLWKSSSVPWKKVLFYGIASFLALGLIEFTYEEIYPWVMHSPLPDQPTLGLLGKTKDISLSVALVTIALLMPLAEEILFRGYLFEALRRFWSGGTAVIITALAFSLVHFQLFYFIPLFGFGLVFGWARLKTDSLHLSILIHMINNGLSLILGT